MKKYSKEHIKLWFEYLKRSGDFKELAKWYRGNLKRDRRRSDPFPKKFKDGNYYHPILWHYSTVGFVEAEAKGWTFEKLWQMRSEQLPYPGFKHLERVRPKPKTLEKLGDFLEKIRPFSIRNYERSAAEVSGTAKDYRQYCIDVATNYLPHYVVIDVESATLTEIRSLLSKFKKAKSKRSISLEKAMLYLKVYDMRQSEVEYREIIKKLGTPEQKAYGYSPDSERQFRRYYNKALKILKNTEKGIFL